MTNTALAGSCWKHGISWSSRGERETLELA